MVAIASGSTPCRSIGSTSRRLKAKPRIAIDKREADQDRGPERQARVIAASMKKAGSITNSPWAKLIVCEVCQSSVKPIATSA